MELKILVKNYQEAFNNQDIDRLRNLFDSNILLKDWERSVQGIENVIKENQKIFDSVKSLKCLTVKEYYQENTAICVLKIIQCPHDLKTVFVISSRVQFWVFIKNDVSICILIIDAL